MTISPARTLLSVTDLALGLFGRKDAIGGLERAFAARYDFAHAIMFPYARSALFGLLRGMAVANKSVVCPAYTCAVVPYAISQSGNTVVFVDSATDHFLPGEAEWSTAVGADTAMAIVTPLYGYRVSRAQLMRIKAAAPNAFIVYDEAQSFGDPDGNDHFEFADGVLLSLGLGKAMTTLGGGMLLLKDDAVASEVRSFRDAYFPRGSFERGVRRALRGLAAMAAYSEPGTWIIGKLGGRHSPFGRLMEDRDLVERPELSAETLSAPLPFQARLGLRQLARLDEGLAAKRQRAEQFESGLRDAGFRTFAFETKPAWLRYPLAVRDRELVMDVMAKDGILLGKFLPYACSELPLYRSQSSAQNAERWGAAMINLPNWIGLGTDQAAYVLKAFLRGAARHPDAFAWPSTS